MSILRRYKLPLSPMTNPKGELYGLIGKPSCKKCYGRGFVGVNTRTGKKMLCGCCSAVFKEEMER